MRPAAILESSLCVTDLPAAAAFYRDVLGLEPISEVEGRHAFFRCGPAVLLLFDADATSLPAPASANLRVPPHGTTGPGHLCFSAGADEITRWKDALEANGVEIEADFEWPGGGRSIYFRDPSGNSLEFAEPRLWEL
jgi:catechol 2,3-dioxygenase-like lactoylglutathione lyase family enzyme